ncbi:Uncharacterized protein SCG7086_BH_00040 [Chlamydiales bacterium SCGC AG-110-P3]|nr:Uncharacterized protein SCG7086_BH_00040 [Chlamydiales bacterium SCGC AG-110-P3]
MAGKEQRKADVKSPIMTHRLPRFRKDLQLFCGPEEADGAPTYNLYDPVSVKYYQVSWEESLIFKHLQPGLTGEQLISAIARVSPMRITDRQLEQFFDDAKRLHLLEVPVTSEEIGSEAERQAVNPVKWLMSNYLYFRIPLINPNLFLEKTLCFVKPLVSRFAVTAYAVLTILGLFQLVARFDEFIYTFPYFYSIQGLFLYAMAITCTKVIHEFAHAYTAKYYKVQVPTMGIAFLVMWPVLYTDVTDAWKLQKRRQRLAITVAGVASELVLAGLSTLGWALCTPGILQSVFFIVASASWISTLVVNLNPAMRFDGYYLLSDLWGVDNLQSRAFSVARWKLRQLFLGIDVPPPERIITESRVWGMVAYSIYTWVYRVFLYTAIALIIYFKFTKVLGVFLFFVEIVVFLGWPIVSELKQLAQLQPYINKNVRLSLTAFCASIVVFWFIIPLPHTMSFVAVTVPQQQQVLYVPHNAIVEKLYAHRGSHVKAGDLLVTLRSPELASEIATTLADRRIVEKEIFILGAAADESRAFLPEKKAELTALEARMEGLVRLQDRLKIYATIDGTVYTLQETLREGLSIAKDTVIGKIASMEELEIVCFVPETLVASMKYGQQIAFHIHDTVEDVTGHVVRIDPTRSSLLPYPQLGSVNHGDLPVVEGPSQEQLILVESYYAVRIHIDKKSAYPLRIGQSGVVVVEGPWRSRLVVFARFVNSILIRESSF